MKENLTLKELCQYLVLFNNDIKTLHWYACGSDFLSIHYELDLLYKDISEWIDNLTELAISYEESPVNPTLANKNLNWYPLEAKDYSFNDLIDNIIEIGKEILNLIDSIDKEKYNSFVYSELDNISALLNKYIKYKFSRF